MKRNLLNLLVVFLSVSFLSGPATAVAPATVPSPATNPVTTFHNAVKEFRHLPRAEKKSRLKEVKKQLKEFKKQKRAGAERPEKAVLI
ncbi:MAG: hypothetical protein EOO01_21470, partial [Chitinophagaceae bacterium]